MRRSSHTRQGVAPLLSSAVATVVGVCEAVAFWTAIVFPMLYVVGFVAVATMPGDAVPAVPLLFGLLFSNLLVLVVGHDYADVE